MLRNLVALTLLALATPVITAPAQAAVTKEELKAQKADVKDAKTTAKKVEKLAAKWHKNSAKGKDNSAVHAELVTYYRAELADLREKGIPTKEKPVHPSEPQPEKPDAPKMEELRDILVQLRDGEVGDKKYGKLLDQYVQRLWQRYERKSERLEKAKG